MKIERRPLVVANWKMNPLTRDAVVKLTQGVKKLLQKIDDVTVVIAPPSIFTDAVATSRSSSKNLILGAQDAHYEKLGSYTGSVSLAMHADFGVEYVIVGHSERRRAGETDELVNTKVLAILKAKMTAIICVGEEKRDKSAHYFSDIEKQIRTALLKVPRSRLEQVVIAYEPIWAIGTGDTATAEDVYEMRLFIEKILSDVYGRNYAAHVRIIYGGSVNDKNARALFEEGRVHGFLVGGASLHPEEFARIVVATRM